MSSINYPNVTGSHPSWCDPRTCETTDSNTIHTSTGTDWTARDADFRLCLTRGDEHAHPGPVPVEVELRVTSQVSVPDAVTVDLSPGEARTLGYQLLAQAALAEGVLGGGHRV